MNLQLILQIQKDKYELGNGATVELMEYYPDYGGIENGEP